MKQSTCIACSKKFTPASGRDAICPPCVERLRARMAVELEPLTETPRGFRRMPVGVID